jgi:hypothetical protein
MSAGHCPNLQMSVGFLDQRSFVRQWYRIGDDTIYDVVKVARNQCRDTLMCRTNQKESKCAQYPNARLCPRTYQLT